MRSTGLDTNKQTSKETLHIDLPGSMTDRPAISALFLVQFDVRTGYAISWQRGVDGLELTDSAEFKSLPSGLHNVADDLVYFVHQDAKSHKSYAGISAFASKTDAAKHERGSSMQVVGALVALNKGNRLGRSWRHADRLKELAKKLVRDPGRSELLEGYWREHRADKQEESVDEGSKKTTEKLEDARRPSLAPGLGQELSLFHPARSFPALLDTFGPLVYSLYRSALLRKRILLSIEVPVELACNFVYNILLLSSVPSSLAEIVDLDPLPIHLHTLFSIGVHDIDTLVARSKPHSDDDDSPTQLLEGWIACTTDDVLIHKKDLYDLAVTLPAARSDKTAKTAWPTLKTSAGTEVKASQRDLRRYRNFRKHLDRRDAASIKSPALDRDTDDETDADDADGSDETPLLQRSPSNQRLDPPGRSDEVELDESLVEPTSWSALAYSGFMWWASAGERGNELEEESTHDAAMFPAFDPYTDAPLTSGSCRKMNVNLMTDGRPNTSEMVLIEYFHRLTTTIFQLLANLVDDSEEDEEVESRQRKDRQRRREGEGEVQHEIEERPAVVVESEDMHAMGLDPWSENDRTFVAQLLDFYWGRKADVRSGQINCCGIRIC